MATEDILDDLWWLFFLARTYGFYSFKLKRSKTGSNYFQYQTWHFILFGMLQTLIYTSGWFVFCLYFKDTNGITGGGLLYILNVVTTIIDATCSLTFCICYKVYNKHTLTFWKKLCEVGNDLRKLKIELNHKLHRNVAIFFVLFTVLYTYFTSFSYAICNYGSDLNIFERLVFHVYYHYMTIIYLLFTLKHIISLIIINDMFGSLEETTKKKFLNANKYKPLTTPEILEIARCHKKICGIKRLGSKIMSIPLLCVFLEIFTIVTAASFKSTVRIINNVYTLEDIESIPWVFLSLLILTALIVSTHKCTEKVSDWYPLVFLLCRNCLQIEISS